MTEKSYFQSSLPFCWSDSRKTHTEKKMSAGINFTFFQHNQLDKVGRQDCLRGKKNTLETREGEKRERRSTRQCCCLHSPSAPP